jgi:hypothetical protein
MAGLPIQDAAQNGSIAELTFTAADVGLVDEFVNDGRTIVIVANGDASPHTVTPAVSRDLGGMVAEAGAPTSIPNGEQGFLGPFDIGTFNTGGKVELTVDAATSMTYAVVRLPRRF